MKRVLFYLFIIVLVAGTISSCSKKNDDTPSTSMKANIGGTDFTAITVAATQNNSGNAGTLLEIAGTTTSSSITLILSGYNGNAGTYTIDHTVDSNYNNVLVSKTLGGLPVFSEYGQIVITSVSGTNLSGTFQFTCSDSTKVTGGTFTCKKP